MIGASLAKWRDGYEVVYGVRTQSREATACPKVVTALPRITWRTIIFRRTRSRNMPAISACSTARWSTSSKAMPERNRFMKGLFAWSGFRQAAVDYERAPRTVGKTKFRYWKLWTLALDGLTSASTMPLRIWSMSALPRTVGEDLSFAIGKLWTGSSSAGSTPR